MDSKEWARLTLLNHAGHRVDPGFPSIIGALRPYTGLDETYFWTLIKSGIILGEDLQSERVPKSLVYAAWDFQSCVHPLCDLLERNRLEDPVRIQTFRRWASCFDSYCLGTFRGLPLPDRLFSVLEYISSDACLDVSAYQSFLPTLEAIRFEADWECRPVLERAIADIRNAI